MGLGNGGGLRLLVREEGVEEEEAGADDDAAVGHVEVGPVVAEDVDLDEVDDGAVAEAGVEIAYGAAEDESESHGCEAEAAAEADERDEDGDAGDGGEGDESPANGVGRCGVGEE